MCEDCKKARVWEIYVIKKCKKAKMWEIEKENKMKNIKFIGVFFLWVKKNIRKVKKDLIEMKCEMKSLKAEGRKWRLISHDPAQIIRQNQNTTIAPKSEQYITRMSDGVSILFPLPRTRKRVVEKYHPQFESHCVGRQRERKKN